ncbi:carboxypeptidase-like regulatory domain-containing protein [Shewanella donghaensis]|uniref:carboxypeptidase-like regulatory domain-containing protein n=1 Tax=Shewanella donghaensis TaxID=238836 RepID=UPI00118268A1|nr:carboxypeptidase-like regulatory domain-containing protein [Shewanella donghaensis]
MFLKYFNRLAKYLLAISLLLLYIELVTPGLESIKPWGNPMLNKAHSTDDKASFTVKVPAKKQTSYKEFQPVQTMPETNSPHKRVELKNTAKTHNKIQVKRQGKPQKKPSASSSIRVAIKDETSPKKLLPAKFINTEQQKIKAEQTKDNTSITLKNNATEHQIASTAISITGSNKTKSFITALPIDNSSISELPTVDLPIVERPKLDLAATCSASISRPYKLASSNEEQFLITLLNYGNQRLSDEMFVYQNDGQLYLPIQYLSDNLMLPIQTEIDPESISGWFLDTENLIQVSHGLMAFNRQNDNCSNDESRIFRDNWDLYLSEEVIYQLLGIEIHYDTARQQINIKEQPHIPLSQLLERQQRYQQFTAQKDANAVTNQRHINTDYANLGDLALHADLGITEQDKNGQHSRSFDGYLQARSDILGHSAYAGYSWSEYGETLNAYVEREMADTWVNYYRLGSIDSHNLALVSSSNSGTGVTVNAGDAFIDDLRYLVIDGEIEPNWDVELYRNGALVSVQRVSETGLYRFEQVPYYIGLNQYQLRFFGPNGESRTESFSKLLDPSQMQANSFGMNFGLMQREQDDLKQIYAAANWAVTDNFTAGITIVEQQISDDKWLFTPTVTLNILTDSSVWQMNLSGNNEGSAANIIAQGSSDLVDWQAEWAKYDNFESWDNQQKRLNEIANVNISGNFAEPHLSWKFSGRWQDQHEASDSLFISNTIAGQFQQLSLSNELSWQKIASNDRWSNRVAVSGRLSDWYLRSYADFSIMPNTELTQLVSNVSKSVNEHSNYQFEIRYQPLAEAEVTFRNSLSYFLDTSTLRLTVENDTEGDWFAQFKWSSSALLIAPDNTWLLDRVSHLNTGSIKLIAFQDDNDNGIFDENELPMSGLTFSGHSNSANETNEDGELLITHIQTSRPHKLTLNERSLPDPFLLPQNSVLLIQAHSGNVAEIFFPVLFTAELDGEIFYNDDVAAKGVPVTLIHRQNNTQYHARVEYDGVFVFEQLVPGEYQVEINKVMMPSNIVLAPGEYVTLPTQIITR